MIAIQQQIARRTSHTTIDGVIYKVAHCREDREAAFRLVHDTYAMAGLTPSNDSNMRVMLHHMDPLTDVFVAKHHGRVVYTATLVTDGSKGIPMESIFPDEITTLRRKGGTLAEVSCLASQEGQFDRKEGFQVYVNLIALLIQSARQNEIDRVLLAVHPRHARFYQHFFGCETLGETKAYAAVLDNPAVPCVHDFAKLDGLRYKLFNHVYGIPFSRWELLRQPMSSSDREYFRSAVDVNAHRNALPMTA